MDPREEEILLNMACGLDPLTAIVAASDDPQPPKSWRDFFGWTPDSKNPLLWSRNGVAVAQYDRLHGLVRDTPHGPHCRQPIIERWLITGEAFQTVENFVGEIRLREDFGTYNFKEP